MFCWQFVDQIGTRKSPGIRKLKSVILEPVKNLTRMARKKFSPLTVPWFADRWSMEDFLLDFFYNVGINWMHSK